MYLSAHLSLCIVLTLPFALLVSLSSSLFLFQGYCCVSSVSSVMLLVLSCCMVYIPFTHTHTHWLTVALEPVAESTPNLTLNRKPITKLHFVTAPAMAGLAFLEMQEFTLLMSSVCPAGGRPKP